MKNIKTNSYCIVDTLFDLDFETMDYMRTKCKQISFNSFQEFDDHVFIIKNCSEENFAFEQRWIKLNYITRQLMFDSIQWCIKNNYRI